MFSVVNSLNFSKNKNIFCTNVIWVYRRPERAVLVEFEAQPRLSIRLESRKYINGFFLIGEGKHREETRCLVSSTRIDVVFPVGQADQAERVVWVLGKPISSQTMSQLDGSTHPCKSAQCGGGVGRNIAEALWRLRGGRTRLLTVVGDDTDGQYLADIAPGLLLDGCMIKNARTATYAAVMDPKGECLLGLGDMGLHDHITIELVNRHMDVLKQAPLVVIDGNVPEATMGHVLAACRHMRKPVFFEPTDRRKAAKLLKFKLNVSYTSPNLIELRAMAEFLNPNASIKQTKDLDEVLKLAKIVSQTVNFIIVTLGKNGVVTIKSKKDGSLVARLYPVKSIENVENVSGAGDCFTGGFISGILSNYKESNNIHIGIQSAKLALMSKNTVPSDLSPNNISISEADYETVKIDFE